MEETRAGPLELRAVPQAKTLEEASFESPRTQLWTQRILVVQSLSHIHLFATPWTAAPQASLSFTISWNLLKFMSFGSMMLSNHLILCRPLSSCPQSFPASRSFPMSPSLHQTKLSSNTSCAALNTLLKLCLAQFP